MASETEESHPNEAPITGGQENLILLDTDENVNMVKESSCDKDEDQEDKLYEPIGNSYSFINVLFTILIFFTS